MSKSKNNFTDPNEILDKYGSDALRLYLISSTASEGEPLRFKETDVYNMNKNVFIPIGNSLKFLKDHITKYKSSNQCESLFENLTTIYKTGQLPSMQLDMYEQYIIKTLNIFRQSIHNKLISYSINSLNVLMENFIEVLNNQFIKLKKDDFKGNSPESSVFCFILLFVLVLYLYLFYFSFYK